MKKSNLSAQQIYLNLKKDDYKSYVNPWLYGENEKNTSKLYCTRKSDRDLASGLYTLDSTSQPNPIKCQSFKAEKGAKKVALHVTHNSGGSRCNQLLLLGKLYELN